WRGSTRSEGAPRWPHLRERLPQDEPWKVFELRRYEESGCAAEEEPGVRLRANSTHRLAHVERLEERRRPRFLGPVLEIEIVHGHLLGEIAESWSRVKRTQVVQRDRGPSLLATHLSDSKRSDLIGDLRWRSKLSL